MKTTASLNYIQNHCICTQCLILEFLHLQYLKWISPATFPKKRQLLHQTRAETPITDLKHPWSFKSLCHIYLNHYLSLSLEPLHQPIVSTPSIFEVNLTYNFFLPQTCTATTPNKKLNTHTHTHTPANTTENHHTISINTDWKQWNCSKMSCNSILEWLHCFQWEHYHWYHSIDHAQSQQAHAVNFTFSFAQKLYSYHTKQGH